MAHTFIEALRQPVRAFIVAGTSEDIKTQGLPVVATLLL